MAEKLLTYSTLQGLIDKLIGKHGITRTYQILQDAYYAQNPGLNQDYCKANIIISLSMEIFSVSPQLLKSGETEQSKKARASSFRLLKMHTGLSDHAISEYFNSGLTRNKIRYARRIAQDVINLPQIDRNYAYLLNLHEKVAKQKMNGHGT